MKNSHATFGLSDKENLKLPIMIKNHLEMIQNVQ